MATGKSLPRSTHPTTSDATEPDPRLIFVALVVSLLFIFATRLPVARIEPFEFDEFGFLVQSVEHWFPMFHTLFVTFGRALGLLTSDPYRGFVVLDMLTSAGALVSLWWMLRPIVRPATAAAAALVMGVSPLFWGYGAMAGNYTAIILVGAFLWGIAYRSHICPQRWQPIAAAGVLAIGTGYRQDIGTLWLPVFLLVLWQHRWKRAVVAGLLFASLNLLWFAAMLHEAHGWARYQVAATEFGYECGYLNSVWNLGFYDGPLRYSVKLGMALIWTLGPALVFVPRGVNRLSELGHTPFFGVMFAITTLPALSSHLLVHFGSPGWCFHYVPGLMILIGLGVTGDRQRGRRTPPSPFESIAAIFDPALCRLLTAAVVLAAMFWFYPTNYDQPGWRGSFDLSFCRFTRTGMKTPIPNRSPAFWRTANSRPLAGAPALTPGGVRAGSG
jgi:hypothetical protein